MKEQLILFVLTLIWVTILLLACRYMRVKYEKRVYAVIAILFAFSQLVPGIVAKCDLGFTKLVMGSNMSSTASLWLLSIFALVPVSFLCVSSLYLLGIMLTKSKDELPIKSSEKKINRGIISLLVAFVVVLTLVIIFFLVNPHIPLISAQPSGQGIEQSAPPSLVKFQTARAKWGVFWLDIGGIRPSPATKLMKHGLLGLSVLITIVTMLLTYLFWWILIQERLVRLLAEKRWIGMLLGLTGFLVFNGVAYDAFATLALLITVSIPLYLLLEKQPAKWLIRILWLMPFAIHSCWEAITVLLLPIDACGKIIGLK